jgi:hypothetical protein
VWVFSRRAAIDLLNKAEPQQRVMLFCIPSRMIRVTATDASFKAFRVEQLVLTNKDPANPRGNWASLSTHGSEASGAAYQDAIEHAIKAQQNLIRKLQQRQPLDCARCEHESPTRIITVTEPGHVRRGVVFQ